MWALTLKSHCRCSLDESRTGRRDLRAYAELAGWSTVLDVAEAETAPITMVVAAPEAIRVGKIVHAVLLTKTEGKAFSIVHLTAKGARAEVWKLLHSKICWVIWSEARNHSTLRGVPEKTVAGKCKCGEDFLTPLTEW